MSNNETFITEGSLSDSVIYKSFNNNSEMTTTILSAIKDSIVIDRSYIEEQLMQMSRTRISPLSELVIDAYKDGDITLLFAKNKKVPQALPFFVTKLQGSIKAIIFVNNYGTISQSEKDSSKKYLNISMKDLYALMEGAYVAREYALKPYKVSKSLQLMKLCSNVYSGMISRILNREYATANDLNLHQVVIFCTSKFFMERVWMCENEDVIFTYAKSNITSTLNLNLLTEVNDEYNEKHIETVDQLIAFLREYNPKLKQLTFRYFIQCYINSYKAGALFGLECLPYFLYTLNTVMVGSFIVNQPVITDITKNIKGMNRFYPELLKAVQ